MKSQFQIYVVIYLSTGKEITIPITVLVEINNEVRYHFEDGDIVDRDDLKKLARDIFTKKYFFGEFKVGDKIGGTFAHRVEDILSNQWRDILDCDFTQQHENKVFTFSRNPEETSNYGYFIINPNHVTHIQVEE